ncbi:ABC transporter permease subunit, partial [Vibrio parahaemolyticus]|uniref:ABC transporter permease subunit n=1 Tax=Vibrio parahaemolyticus TaxID=670 RepID=UPI001A8CC48D
LTGLSVGALIGGPVIAETVFGLQGIGSLTVTAVRNRDIPLVMGVVVFVSFAVWVANFSAELLQIVNETEGWLTPNAHKPME